jgi:hypothetical protein
MVVPSGQRTSARQRAIVERAAGASTITKGFGEGLLRVDAITAVSRGGHALSLQRLGEDGFAFLRSGF